MSSSPAPAVVQSEVLPVSSPQVILVLGMAGSGKTTYVSRLLFELQRKNKRTFAINLDPAVKKLPYTPNIDIRDSVDYGAVMRDFDLGPNGAIITSLNLFVTKFDQVLDALEAKKAVLDFVIVDTPGQIEVFNWSASGQIISDAFSVSFPTAITYVLDSERCANPLAFVSNMTYVVSVLFKYRLPFILALNKADLVVDSPLSAWLSDFSVLLDALAVGGSASSYMASFARSLCLALEEFYASVDHLALSSITGLGFDELIDHKLAAALAQYQAEFLPEVEDKRRVMAARKEAEAKKTMAEFKRPSAAPKKRATAEEDEDEDDAAELEKLRALLKAKK